MDIIEEHQIVFISKWSDTRRCRVFWESFGTLLEAVCDQKLTGDEQPGVSPDGITVRLLKPGVEPGESWWS